MRKMNRPAQTLLLALIWIQASCAREFPSSRLAQNTSAEAMLMAAATSALLTRCNGQGFCYFFATSGSWLGDLGGLTGVSGADSRCISDANKPSGGTYKAVISDGSTRIASITANMGDGQANWVLYPNTEYRRPDGVSLMTTNANSIFVFGTLSAIITAVGTYHTGMNNGWNAGVHCNGWTDNTAGNNTRYGSNSITGSAAISFTQAACNATARGLYCAQQ